MKKVTYSFSYVSKDKIEWLKNTSKVYRESSKIRYYGNPVSGGRVGLEEVWYYCYNKTRGRMEWVRARDCEIAA